MKKIVYNIIKFIVKMCYHNVSFEGLDNLPNEPVVIIMNHCHMYGPIVGELYFPTKPYIWCAEEMMHLKEVPAYTYWDFWRNKPNWSKWFYKILSYIIAPLSVCLFGCARTIGVYHDKRVISAFRETVAKLKEGENVIIFPETDKEYNHIICGFQEGFVDVAKSYYKQTGKALKFIPAYLAPTLHKVVLGEGTEFNPQNDMKAERERICSFLAQSITSLAVGLPLHTVIPYNNIPKKNYKKNKEEK